jgi:hypothetical protein
MGSKWLDPDLGIQPCTRVPQNPTLGYHVYCNRYAPHHPASATSSSTLLGAEG